MAWSTLPEDVQDHILGGLSLRELGRVATTCRSFHAFSHRQMAEHKARCELDVLKWFGHKRITVIADIVNDFLKGEGLVFNLTIDRTSTCQISSDGLLQIQDPAISFSRSLSPNGPTFEAGEIIVRVVCPYVDSPSPSTLWLYMRTPSLSGVGLLVDRRMKVVSIKVTGKEDALYSEGEAFVQALLSWGFGPQHDAWLHADVHIVGLGSTCVELKAGRAPPTSGGPAPKLAD